MPKKTTLKEIAEMLTHVVKHMATKDDLVQMRKEMATKEQLIGLQSQVNSIETQLRGMSHVKLVDRVSDLEEKVFGESRG
jgi:hypothetical protein